MSVTVNWGYTINKSKIDMLCTIVSIAAITIIEVAAIWKGVNGVGLASALSGIAFIGGAKLRKHGDPKQ